MRRPLVFLGIAATLLLGCGGRPTQPNTPAPLDNPEITAGVVFDTVFGGVRIWAVATVRNGTNEAGLVTLRNPCPVVIEIYGSEALVLPPRWEEWRYRLGCKSFANPISLQPHQVVTVSSYPTPIREILGDSLSAGRYWGAVVVTVRELESGFIRLSLGPLDLGM